MEKQEKNKIINAVIFPLLFVVIIGIVHLTNYYLDLNLGRFGIYPKRISGLIGIITAPLIHGDFKHLFNNSIPLLILGTALFYFYKEVAFKVSLLAYLMVGLWTWISAREAYHIGASGVLYALFSFLMVSGFIRRNIQLIALSFFVVFIYGSLIWGVFPMDLNISFEGHLWGFVAGVILAIFYRNKGPQRKKYDWENEDDDDDLSENKHDNREITIHYHIKD